LAMQYVERIAARIERASASVARLLDRRPVAAWCVFSLLYFGAAAWRASRKPFWYDELVTLHLSRLPGMTELWAAFRTATDSMPPLLHLLTGASVAIFGEGHVSARVPAMVGVWIMCLCLYVFVRRHCPALYGWAAAATMALAMASLRFCEEARCYGLLMGFTGLALVFWQSAIGRHRRLCLCGLALSVAAAVFCHSLAGLLVAVLGSGELARARVRRKLDWAVFAALLAAASAILLLIPSAQAGAAAYAGSQWSRPRLSGILEAYQFLLGPLVVPLWTALVLACAWWSLRAANDLSPARSPVWRMPHAEAVLALAFLALPVLTAMAGFLTGVFAPRYALPALAGLCIMTAYLSRAVERNGPMLGVLVVATALAWLALETARRPPLTAYAQSAAWALAARTNPDLPIVVDDAFAFLCELHYAPRDIAPRLVFLADAARAHRASGNKSATTGLVLLARRAPLRVEQPERFLAAHRRFYLLGTEWFESWLRAHLVESGAGVRLLRAGKFGELYLVEIDR